MKRFILLTILVHVSVLSAFSTTGIYDFKSGLYHGKKRGVLSSAKFYLQITDSVATLEQYREFGGVLYLELADTLYFGPNKDLRGSHVYICCSGKELILRSIEGTNSWNLNIKLRACDEEEYRQYDIFRNRLLLDTLSFQHLPMNVYRPLVNNAYHMKQEEFKLEIEAFAKRHGLRNSR